MVATVRVIAWIGLILVLATASSGGSWLGDHSALAEEQGQVPGGSLGNASDPDFWRAIRRGEGFTTSLPNPSGGVLIQSEGDNWRAFRNGPLSEYGAWALLGIVALLALFFVVRGRIRLEHGWSGHRITRFNFVDRFAHWRTSTCWSVRAGSGRP